MIYKKVDFNSFVTAFDKAGRKNQFSLYGLKMLYDYLNDIHRDGDNDLELDVIGLCCQYAEYTQEEFLSDYSIEGIGCIDSLEKGLIDGDLDCVIAYNLDNDIILVNSEY